MAARSATRPPLARVWALFAALLAFGLIAGAVSAGAAESKQRVSPQALRAPVTSLAPAAVDPDKITVSVERASAYEPDNNTNAVSVDVTIRDSAGQVPKANYAVFSQVFVSRPADGAEPTKSAPEKCQQPHYTTNPEIDSGVYRCSYLVDFPDVWTFEITVNKTGVANVVKLASVQYTTPVNDAVVLSGQSKGLRYVVEGRTFEVFLLQSHFAAASIWLLMVTVMAFLAVPRLRRMCSTLTLHTLEVRRHFLNSVMWAMFLAVLGTGIYLLRTQTAYTAPWSKSAWDNITKLPYATQYFTTLYVKILIFVIMAAASVVLMMEAARQARLAGDAGGGDGGDEEEFWSKLQYSGTDDEGGGGIAARRPDAGSVKTAVAKPRSKMVTEGVSSRTLWACVFVVAGGMGAIGVCVTVLKYTHELIEMLVAAKTVAESVAENAAK